MIKKAIFILCSAFFWMGMFPAVPLHAAAAYGPEVWTDLGLNGGHVNALAVDPADPQRVFSGIYLGEGLFRSTDAAASWQALRMGSRIDGEGTFENQSVMAIAVAPGNPQVVWAAHNQWVAKSTDGGDTWTHIRNGTMQKDCRNCSGSNADQFRFCWAIAIDPYDADTVYVGTGGPWGAYTSGAVYRTTDGGGTWEKLNGGGDLDYTVTSIALHKQRPGVIWAVTGSYGAGGVWDGTVYLSTDDGASFKSPDPRPISSSGLTGVTWHPADPYVVFITGGLGVVRMAIDDSSWLPAYAVAGSALAAPVAFAPSDANVAYTGWNRPTGWGGDGTPKISRSRDSGLTWQTTTLDPTLATSPNCIAVDPLHADILYWGDAGGGVLKSEDGGMTWTPVNQGLNGIIVHDVDGDPKDGSHLVAATTGGVYERLSDQWHKRLNLTVHAVRFDPIDSATYYAGLGGSLAKTQDGGRSWTFSSDSADGWIFHIEIDPVDTDILFIADESHVRRSSDGGDTFTAVLAGINSAGEPYNMNAVAIDPADRRRILAGGGNFFAPRVTGGLWESMDGGNTWQITGLGDAIVNDVLIHRQDPKILLAGCGYSGGNDTPLFKSIDGGATWATAVDGLPPEQILLQDIWVSRDEIIFAVGNDGDALRMAHNHLETLDTGTRENLYAVFGIDAGSVWAVGDQGIILRFDGRTWSSMASPSTVSLRSIWGPSIDRLYAVGAEGEILTYRAGQWNIMDSPTGQTLHDVFGMTENDVIAVGAAGTILHYDGRQWTTMASPTAEDLSTVWGSAQGKWFVGGENGTILVFDGNAWSVMPSGTQERISGIWGGSKNDVYAVAALRNELLHFDGEKWVILSAPFEGGINDIWGIEGRSIYLIQSTGGIFSHDDTGWQTLRAAGSRFRSVTDLAFHRANPDIVYAGTLQAGVFISPNQGGRWLNLGTPRLQVNAIAAGSLYAATSGGLYQLTGTGVLAGEVYDGRSRAMLDGIQVASDLGLRCAAGGGQYMMVSPAGIFDLYATADQYDMAAAADVTVVGGDVTWQDFEMQPASGLGGSASGSLTVESDNSGGGAYCFIATVGAVSKTGRVWIAVILAVGLMLLAGFGRRRPFAWLPLIVAAGIFCHGSSVEAFTLFQQVGVTSPPSPVGSGARAMGMGGTFIAIADDATAASWNPAGLVQLERPEVSIVGDYYWRTESYDSDRHPEVANTSRDDHGNLNYLSATVPFHWHRNMVVSVNYQRLYDFYQNLNFHRNLSQGPIQLDQQINFDQSGTVGAIGLAGGVEITPRLSLGLTVNVWTDQLGYDNGWESNYNETATGFQAGVPVTVQTRIQDRYEEFRGINFNLGLLWETDGWGSLGAVVKTPFTAKIQHHFQFYQTQIFGTPLDTTVQNGPIRVDEEVELSMPWSYGLGWSRRFTDRFTLGVDIYRTEWSGYYLEDGQGNEFSPIDGRRRADSDVDATTHVRLGGEYLLLWPVKQLAAPLRLGLFYDPEPSEGHPQDVFGIALGSGISTSRFSIDLAYQLRWADDIDTGNIIATSSADMTRHTVLASLIYYF